MVIMKITAATIAMQSQHLAAQRQATNESLHMWVGNQRPDFEGRNQTQRLQGQVDISSSGLTRQSTKAGTAGDSNDSVSSDPTLNIIRRLVEMLTGRPVKVYQPDAAPAQAETATPQDAPQPKTNATNQTAGFGVEYDYHSVSEETEATSFSAQGVVKTADGKDISFNLNLNMSRYQREEIDVSFRAGDAVRKDPLVINFDGNAAQLIDQHFRFDLNADGVKEEVATLASGSGYLALDRNGNGTIDSGAELFGPATGSGFAELATYDQDHNGWIDENDAVFTQLSVWTPAAENGGSLETLQARNVGAIFLGQVATPFELRGAQNSDLGAVAATGLYLTEDGQAKTLQEIDLSV
jgi:hypothetical protein